MERTFEERLTEVFREQNLDFLGDGKLEAAQVEMCRMAGKMERQVMALEGKVAWLKGLVRHAVCLGRHWKNALFALVDEMEERLDDEPEEFCDCGEGLPVDIDEVLPEAPPTGRPGGE